ncbi:MAG: monovalent cation/H+ antiporter subunit D family protein [Dethiobacteria bacterium]|nr:monovalent cation/H+ antiporter subunit D family protein [Dethiobacteria bacterium]
MVALNDTIVIAILITIVGFPIVMTPVIMYADRVSGKLRNSLALVTSAIAFILTLTLYPSVAGGRIVQYTLFEVLPNLEISLRLDILSFCLAVLATFIWFLCTVYSVDYMAKEHACGRYYPVLIFTLGSCQGIFFAGDLFSLFVFFELMSIVAYILVIHEETEEALKAGYKYLVMTIIGGLALFFGIIIVFELGGTVSLGVGTIIDESSLLALIAFICFLIGFGMKAGMFPLHVWLPDAHPVAPSPASALLSGVMLKTGAYGLLRVIFNVFSPDLLQSSGWDSILGVLAVITILLGSAVALTQTDIKRRLAYSSISQLGYVLLGLSILNNNAITGAVFHIFSHAFMKSTLFLAAGAVIWKTGIRNINDMKGLGRQMPITMGCFSIAALAMIGIPPLNGFLSKWTLALGALDANMPFYVLVLLISSLLNALYYLPILIPAFFELPEGIAHDPHDHHDIKVKVQEASPRMLSAIVVLALCTIFFGLTPNNIAFALSRLTAAFLLLGGNL